MSRDELYVKSQKTLRIMAKAVAQPFGILLEVERNATLIGKAICNELAVSENKVRKENL